jgi:NAD(P)-dependent dehydrogenase (short-subunit alcohol dehydrogenase family)
VRILLTGVTGLLGRAMARQLIAAGHAATDLPQPRSLAASEAKLSERMAASARASREMAYDTTIRFTHELRMTLRELGSRYADAELIDVAGELFYLTCDEAVTLPSDARLRIKRRRAERERFQGQRLPDIITIR